MMSTSGGAQTPGAPAAPAPTAPPPTAAAPAAAAPANRQVIGRLLSVSGAQVTVGLSQAGITAEVVRATVGKFLGILSGNSVIVGMITEITERPVKEQEPQCRSTAQLDLV